MQLIDYISETCLDKIKSQILNFVSENGCSAIYYTANFNNYSNTSPLIESVCARLAKYLIVFCDASSAKAYRIEDDKGYLFITVDWDKNIDARLFAKIFKVMPHLFFPKTVKTIWLDANISMKNDDVELVRELEKSDLILFSHNKRNSVTEEYMECLKFQKDSSQKLKQFSEFLLQNEDPEFLCQGRIIYRNTNLKIQNFNEIWWDYIRRGSIRDQLSLPYAINHSNIITKLLPPARVSCLFQIHFHNKISFHHRSNFANILLSLKNIILKMREVVR